MEDGKEKLFDIIHKAVQDMKCEVEDIVVLSPINQMKTEVIGTMKTLTKKNFKETYKIQGVKEGVFKNGTIGFSEIGKFKGKERKFVILTGINDFSDLAFRNKIYVALTRATHMCSMLLNEEGLKSYRNQLM